MAATTEEEEAESGDKNNGFQNIKDLENQIIKNGNLLLPP